MCFNFLVRFGSDGMILVLITRTYRNGREGVGLMEVSGLRLSLNMELMQVILQCCHMLISFRTNIVSFAVLKLVIVNCPCRSRKCLETS